MASKRLSPSAQLLRRSRLFSLPPVLAHPPEEQKGVMKNFNSDTATLRYPTHATIETPPSSLARGDWGLKRPLPLKSTTNTSTPLVRVKEIDNIDHITDYESAADHTLTLRKWQEMNIPLTWAEKLTAYFNKVKRKANEPHNVFDVFEKNARSPTELEQSMQEGNRRGSTTLKEPPYPKRWKFEGPWLGGMNSVEFERFVEKQVKARRAEFRQYLRQWILREKKKKARDKALNAGKILDEESITLSSNEFHTEIVRLRRERLTLSRIIWTFLDLPGALEAEGDHDLSPPVTHPSAGLSYLRSDSHVYNHPLLGPQAHGPPVRSRVLRRSHSEASIGLVGMGGVVAHAPAGLGHRHDTNSLFEEHGGERGWYQADLATIDSRGRIDIRAQRASDDAIAVWEQEFRRSTTDQKKQKDDINKDMEQNIRFDSISKNQGGNLLPEEKLIKQSPRAPRQ